MANRDRNPKDANHSAGLAHEWLPWGLYLDKNPFTATSYPYSVAIDRDTTFMKLTYTFYVTTTNSGSSYWKFSLIRWSDIAVIKLLDTSAASPDTQSQVTTTSFTIPSIGTNGKGIYILLEKVGTPGTLYLGGPLLEVST